MGYFKKIIDMATGVACVAIEERENQVEFEETLKRVLNELKSIE